MSERRASYRYQGVLIETARILSPQFDDALVYLTGAQIEMLRNVSHYLNRRNTYVSEYQPDYYLWPTDADYDDILEIVADLEETLMGNPNTIWGYKDRWSEDLSDIKSGDGTFQAETTPVPAGYVYVVESVMIRNNSGDRGPAWAGLRDGVANYYLFYNNTPVRYEPDVWTGTATLKEGDYILIVQGACIDLDDIKAGVWGHKMKVPE